MFCGFRYAGSTAASSGRFTTALGLVLARQVSLAVLDAVGRPHRGCSRRCRSAAVYAVAQRLGPLPLKDRPTALERCLTTANELIARETARASVRRVDEVAVFALALSVPAALASGSSPAPPSRHGSAPLPQAAPVVGLLSSPAVVQSLGPHGQDSTSTVPAARSCRQTSTARRRRSTCPSACRVRPPRTARWAWPRQCSWPAWCHGRDVLLSPWLPSARRFSFARRASVCGCAHRTAWSRSRTPARSPGWSGAWRTVVRLHSPSARPSCRAGGGRRGRGSPCWPFTPSCWCPCTADQRQHRLLLAPEPAHLRRNGGSGSGAVEPGSIGADHTATAVPPESGVTSIARGSGQPTGASSPGWTFPTTAASSALRFSSRRSDWRGSTPACAARPCPSLGRVRLGGSAVDYPAPGTRLGRGRTRTRWPNGVTASGRPSSTPGLSRLPGSPCRAPSRRHTGCRGARRRRRRRRSRSVGSLCDGEGVPSQQLPVGIPKESGHGVGLGKAKSGVRGK